jgi:predicted O-methyltransferase YrrM
MGMSSRKNGLPAGVHDYLLSVSLRENPIQARLREVTAPRAESEMQIGPEQGQFMALLVHLIGARRCIELGTYTGYSALAVALALPPDGSLVACDVSDEFTRIGRPFWREAGVESKIDLRLQPALKTLDELLAQPGGRGGFDFAFIDADKGNYIAYYEKLLQLVRRGGLIAVDNTLGASGRYVTELTGPLADAIRAFNGHVSRDPRVELSMLPLGEGLTLLRVL